MTRDAFGQPITAVCPDCNANIRAVEIGTGITVLRIAHDDTCPWMKRREAHGNPRT